MKYIEEKIINARPAAETDNERFVRQTITAVQAAHTSETFEALHRTEGANKNKETFMTKLLAMPKFASIALGVGVVVATGGAAYAAVNWFGAHVSMKQKADMVYSVSAECSPSNVQALQNNKSYTNTARYQILKPELISREDLQLDELSTCEQRAIETSLRMAMPDVYRPGDSEQGLYYPVGKYGTVVSATASTVTVTQVPVEHQTGSRELITATLTIHPDVLVTDQGKKSSVASFKEGDQVYFVFQNSVRPNQNDNDWRAAPSAQSTVRAIAKTQYDIKSIKEKVFKASSEGAFQILEKSDAYGG